MALSTILFGKIAIQLAIQSLRVWEIAESRYTKLVALALRHSFSINLMERQELIQAG